MGRFNCKHDWEVDRDYSVIKGVEMSSLFKCKKCKVVLTAHEATELELWKNTVGIQKWLSVGAFLIALASLVITFLK